MPLVIKTTGVEEFLDATGNLSIKALILGAPSAGKTRSASFWPRPIFADCEKGRLSLADRRVPFADITSSSDMEQLLLALEAECRKPPAQRKYQTLVLDTLDAYQRIVIQERLKAERKEALSGFADWGHLDAKMTALISRLLRLPMNLVVNVHVKESKDGEDGPLVTQLKLKGDVREQIAADFDLVGLMSTHWEAQGGQRVLTRTIQWHPEPRYPVLKDRSGQLPKHTEVRFDDDDYQQLFEAITTPLDDLAPQEQVDEFSLLPTGPAPEAPRAGGPVAQSAETTEATTRGARKGTTAPKATPQASRRSVPAAKKPEPAPEPAAEQPAEQPTQEAGTSSVPPAAEPVQQPVEPAAAEQDAPVEASGVEVAQAVLGGTVIDTQPLEPDVADQEGAATPVQPAAAEPAQPPAAEPEQDGGVRCGTPVPGTTKSPKPGCGRDLSGENVDLVNIAEIRFGTSLCPDCMKAAPRAA